MNSRKIIKALEADRRQPPSVPPPRQIRSGDGSPFQPESPRTVKAIDAVSGGNRSRFLVEAAVAKLAS